MGLNVFQVLVVILLLSVGKGERRHDNCVTWSDDLLTLTITCRVANYSQPVTISHEKNGIRIHCTITEKKSSCYPAEKNISVDRHNHNSVVIKLLELKYGETLQGRWQCTQGGTRLFTYVSFHEGLISDSWVQIRGKINHYNDGRRDVIAECSSCRIPKASYVEFLVNNKSYGSMLQNEHNGVCSFDQNNCNPYKCNCSSTGNMFSLRLPHDDNIHRIACEMHFDDALREGKYSIVASMGIKGEGITYDASITDILVKNKYKHTGQTQNKTVTDDQLSMDNNTLIPVQPDQGISTSLTVVIVIVPLVTVISVIVVLWNKRKLQKTNVPPRRRKGETIRTDIQLESKTNEETTTLMNKSYSEPKSSQYTDKVQCEICKREVQENFAEWICLNCEKKMCSACDDFHTKFKLIQDHVVLPLNKLPSEFSTSLNCVSHNKKEFTFYCKRHNKILCVDCLNDHGACDYCDIREMSGQTKRVELKHDLEILVGELDSQSKNIDFFQQFFLTKVGEVKREIARLRDSQKADQKTTLSKIEQTLYDQLELKQKTHNTRYESQITENRKFIRLVEFQIRHLNFITDNVNNKLLFVYIHQARKKFDQLKLLIKETDTDLTSTELNFRWTLVDQCLGKIESKSSKKSTLEHTDSTVASQTPSLSIPVYSYHEKEFQLGFSKLAYVFDGSLVLGSNGASNIVVYNPMTYTQNIVDIKYQPHCIEMIPNTKRAIVTCETNDLILELDLENNKKLKNIDIEDCARAVLATTPCFILLGLRSKNIISVLKHDGQCVLNIETNNQIDRLCYYEDRITYISSNSNAIISIDVTGKEVSLQGGKPRPVDILTTDRGHVFVLEESERALRKCSIDGKEISLDFEVNIILKNVTAFCSNADASKIYILSRNEKETVLSVLANVKEESSTDKLKGTLDTDENESKDSALQT